LAWVLLLELSGEEIPCRGELAPMMTFHHSPRDHTKSWLLLIGIDREQCVLLKMILGDLNYEYFIARNSAEALTCAPVIQPDLILIDPAVEGERGLSELEERLKEGQRMTSPPLLFLSRMPINRDELRSAVARLAGQPQRRCSGKATEVDGVDSEPHEIQRMATSEG